MGAQLSSGDDASGGVNERYHIQKVKLGTGAFGTVWRAVDRQTSELVAMKQLDKNKMAKNHVKSKDVQREVDMMRAYFHENLLRLIATFDDGQFIYLALEYCGDGDLADKMKERSFRLQDHEAAAWMRQICAAIAELHRQGICHRDIKPDNFMISGEILKLADFGLAVFLKQGSLLNDKSGTPAFMAPELV